MSSEDLQKASFDPHLNEKFEVQTDTVGAVEAELVEITDHNRENLDSFSLLFKVPKDTFFNQKLYKVKHAKMGEIQLFLVPVVSMKQDALYYEATFCRLLEKK